MLDLSGTCISSLSSSREYLLRQNTRRKDETYKVDRHFSRIASLSKQIWLHRRSDKKTYESSKIPWDCSSRRGLLCELVCETYSYWKFFRIQGSLPRNDRCKETLSSVRSCIIKLMLNDWLHGGVISGRDRIPGVLFQQSKFEAIIHSRSSEEPPWAPVFSPRHAIVVFVVGSLSFVVFFGNLGSRQVFELVPSWSSIDILVIYRTNAYVCFAEARVPPRTTIIIKVFYYD